MIKGRLARLRTIRPDELVPVYRQISDINAKGRYWHLDIISEQAFRREYAENGCFGDREGRMLIVPNNAMPEDDYILDSDTPVGQIIYFKGLDYQSGVEVGYELFSSAHYGKGYMSEALSLFCSWLFAARPFNRIQVNLMKGNVGSRRVAEKCGFVYEGTMRQATYNRGCYHDLELFSLLRSEAASLEGTLQNTGF